MGTIHASKARFARWERITYVARLMYCYNNAQLLQGLSICTRAQCPVPGCGPSIMDAYVDMFAQCSYGGTD